MDNDVTYISEIAGYVAAILVFSTFYTKTMIPLRLVAITSNVAFITYGYLGNLYPVLILHITLLPLNIFRLMQMYRLIVMAKKTSEQDFRMDWLIPYMEKEVFVSGDVVFKKGDTAEKMYIIHSGSVLLDELGITLGTGEIIGETGIFSPTKRRMASAVIKENTELYTMTDTRVLELYFQNPNFGFYLIKLITARLLEKHPKGIHTEPEALEKIKEQPIRRPYE